MESILDACAEGLLARGYEGLTTNAIAERAGVSVGTLYQYFAHREAIAASLATRAFERLLSAMRQALSACVAERMGHLAAAEHMLVTGLSVLKAEAAVFRILALEAPHVFRLPAVSQAQAALLELSQDMRLLAGDTIDLANPQADAWLIGHMISAAIFQISLLDVDEAEQVRLAREAARLSCKMSLRHDYMSGSRRETAAS